MGGMLSATSCWKRIMASRLLMAKVTFSPESGCDQKVRAINMVSSTEGTTTTLVKNADSPED